MQKVGGLLSVSRALHILRLIGEGVQRWDTNALADELSVHRSVAYRILKTLEAERFIVQRSDGTYAVGGDLAMVGQSVLSELREASYSTLRNVADALNMTAYIAVREGVDVVVIASVFPKGLSARFVYEPGTRHSIHLGAPSIAIQSLISQDKWRRLVGDKTEQRAEVEEVRRRKFVWTRSEVISGGSAVATPIITSNSNDHEAALAVVYVETTMPIDDIGTYLAESAQQISAKFRP